MQEDLLVKYREHLKNMEEELTLIYKELSKQIKIYQSAKINIGLLNDAIIKIEGKLKEQEND